MLDQCRPTRLFFLNTHVTIVVPQVDSQDGLSVLDHRVPFGWAPPLHVHRGEDEVFHLMHGRLLFQIGDERRTARAGDTVLAPQGVPHAYRVLSTDGARFLTVSRGNVEMMVRSLSRPADGLDLPQPVAQTRASMDALAERCAAFGVEMVGPPIRA